MSVLAFSDPGGARSFFATGIATGRAITGQYQAVQTGAAIS